jgi:cytochrome b6-f complex iron-sulfur subunit
MTELERRNFLLWAAGVSFTYLTAGVASAAARGAFAELDSQKPGEKQKPASNPASKPAVDNKVFETGDQKDGAFVYDPASPPKVELSTRESPNGTFVKVGKDTVLVAQSADKKKWHAVSAICTHKACAISFKSDDNCFRCPCHGSKFGLDGKVQKKPATDDLTAYDVKEVKGKGGKKLLRVAPKA